MGNVQGNVVGGGRCVDRGGTASLPSPFIPPAGRRVCHRVSRVLNPLRKQSLAQSPSYKTPSPSCFFPPLLSPL